MKLFAVVAVMKMFVVVWSDEERIFDAALSHLDEQTCASSAG
jgi:hypothetical protein